MVISAQTRILLLLTAALGSGGGSDSGAPLDADGFDRVAGWLKRTRLKPVDLLDPETVERLAWAPGAPVPLERLVALLRQAPVLDAAVDRWERSGLWVIGRDDPDYPRRMKRRLRGHAPALLFGRGDRLLLNRGGIALVGGDAPDAEPVGYAARFAARIAAGGLSTLAGLRNAVEEAALLGSLSRGGVAVAVLPSGLEREVAGERLRDTAGGGQLVLVSETAPESPEPRGGGARGSGARCLYGLSDAAHLIAVGRDSARWADAVEAIEADWVPHWVRANDPEAGSLIRLGARAVPDEEVAPRALLMPAPRVAAVRPGPRPEARAGTWPESRPDSPMTFPPPAPAPVLSGFAEEQSAFPAPPPAPAPASASATRGAHLRLVGTPSRTAPPVVAEPQGESLFDVFGRHLAALLADGPLGLPRIAEAMELTRQQAEAWLLRAETEARVQMDPATRLYHVI